MATATFTPMSADEALGKLDQLMAKLNFKRANLADEIAQAQEEFDAIARLSGRRADHAAEFLKRLRPHLEDFRSFFETCTEQIDHAIDNPWGDRDIS